MNQMIEQNRSTSQSFSVSTREALEDRGRSIRTVSIVYSPPKRDAIRFSASSNGFLVVVFTQSRRLRSN